MYYYFRLLIFLNPSWFSSACFTFSVHENFIHWILLLKFLGADITQSLKSSTGSLLLVFGGFESKAFCGAHFLLMLLYSRKVDRACVGQESSCAN